MNACPNDESLACAGNVTNVFVITIKVKGDMPFIRVVPRAKLVPAGDGLFLFS